MSADFPAFMFVLLLSSPSSSEPAELVASEVDGSELDVLAPTTAAAPALETAVVFLAISPMALPVLAFGASPAIFGGRDVFGVLVGGGTAEYLFCCIGFAMEK